MNRNFEPTILPYNRVNKNDMGELSFDSISIKKSLIDSLGSVEDLDYNLLFLAAVCITLTKYTNNTSIFIHVNNIPLIFNSNNRKETVIDYIKIIEEYLSHPVSSKNKESYFNFIYNGGEDKEDYNISLSLFEESQLYILKLKFDSSRYTHSYINSFLRSIKKVINQFINKGIDKLKIENILLRCENKVPEFKLLRNPLVNELLEAQSIKTPDKIALRVSGEAYTFKQINDESNKIANGLLKRGFKKGDSVSFMLSRNKTLITSFLGIIKAGCVAIPLDMNYPLERINYIKQNSDSKFIITYESIEGGINPDDLINEGDPIFPDVQLKADDPIFILYTSGSTGNPKGVISKHCGISNLTATHIKNNYEKLLSITSIAFDISEEDILISFTSGKELIFANDDEIEDILLLSRLIEKTKPEFVNLTPSRLLSYLQVPEFANSIKHLKGIGCGGEKFTGNVYDIIKKYADIDIYNGYGPLETSLTSNSKKITNPDYITNGKPLKNYITDVRDIDGKLLPYGVIGELYIGGLGVSKGYYKMEDKTKKTFISINDVPYYKTGDYAVQLPSDEIIIKGRVDNQIKLRGQRVELEEIEQVISKFPNIENAIATVYELNHEKHLCAYFTSQINIKIDDLIDYLSSTLSAFMIPTFLIQLEEFPQTPNGKIDRKLLPKPKMDIENVKPNSSLEKTLYCFCTKILNQNYFGVTDNLFKLGFTSITLMKLNSYIFHEFNISLKHTDLMNNPTIREISDALENKSSIDDIKKIVPSDSNKYPMSSQQKRLYVIYCQYPNLTNYNLPNLIKLEKPINVKRLEKAINHVIDCEEILRTSFHIENGEYIQKIHNNRRIKLDLIKVKDDIEEVIRQNIRPFNLESEPLIRIKVIEFKGETYIFRDMHHIIGDQISNDLLYDKIKDSYNNKPISTSEIQYKDYVFWLKKQQVKQADFWRNMNISESGSQLFADFKRPLIQSFNGNKISSNIDKNLIVKVAKENNTTIYKLLLLQFVVLLHKYTNESFIQIGTLTSGRTHPNLEETLGMFVNTLPFIQDILVDKTLKENLIITEEILSGIFENQDYSIEQIIDEYKLSTANSYNPLFNILFIQNTANDFDNRLDVDELKFDLTCTVKNSSSDLIIEFEYNQDLYSFEKIHNLLNHYIYLINNIEENMNKKIRDIKILSPLEEDNIIRMSGSNDDFDSNSILSELNTQIDKNPTQVILSDDKTDLRYAEFDLKTNSLANYLHDNFGIKKQDNIIVIAKRSIESVLAFYSILKLNGVYIPINPFAPKNRIKHIVNQTNPKVILTNLDLDLDNINIVNLNQKLLYDYDDSKIESTCEANLCILHTSGTTGVPKGVIISHNNVEKFLISAKNKFYNPNTKIFYHTTNIGFDTSLFEIIYSIVYGIQLYIINENYDFSKIPKDILYSKSMINTVPSKLNMFFTLPNFDDVMKNTYQLILAGEALNENLVRDIRKKYNPIIYNGYGPCETTIFASIKEISSTNKVTIGKPNLNTHIYILNNDKQLCPIGIPGELCIGGKQVSAGYLDKNETKHHFINNLFGNDIIYCTGDLAYLDFDGELNFIGRKDSQIKINGQRIELEEVNKAIENYGNIIQAVTIPNSNKTQLYSYLVSEEIIDIDELFKYLETILLPFMIPTSIMQIDSIPLSNNGKININKLPEPEFINDNYIAPTNDIEKSIVKVWENVLDVKKIGINDNFYYLGGDSIKAIRIISILQNKGFFVQYNDILNYKTPYLIAQNIEKKPQVTYDSIKGIIDLLPIQNYFFDQINRNDYTQEFILESKKDLNINLLQKSFDELTNLHDMLRASFKIENNKPVQEILPLNSRVSEINEFKIKDDLKNNMAEIIKDRKNSINVFNKLIDISLIHHNDKTFLIFIIHHLIIDGISWGILLDDLSHIYSQLESEYNSNLFTYPNFRQSNQLKFIRPYSYKNWVEDVKNLVENISPDEKQHWIEINGLLDDLKIKGKSISFNFNVNVDYRTDNLLMLSEEEYLALAIARAYKKTYGKDIIFNRESYGRDESIASLHRTIGWFTSQYPVFVNISTMYDDISIMRDVYNLKTAFRNISNFGLNYSSLVYFTHDFKYKHCPVTFNFLSTEFIFENELFKSVNEDFDLNDEGNREVYGVDFNINRVDDIYYIIGDYPQDTFIGEEISLFFDNIRFELDFIANFYFEDNNIICNLSQPQLEVYYNEINQDLGTAYSTWDKIECPNDKSINQIKEAIFTLIDKHPILKGRILDDGLFPLLICDSYPLIETRYDDDFSNLIREFDLKKYLARFYIIDKDNSKFVFYDIHHIINDAMGFNIVKNDLIAGLEGKLNKNPDLGFVYGSKDSFESQFEPFYKSAHEFYKMQFKEIDNVNTIEADLNGSRGMVSLPIREIRNKVEKFTFDNNITVGTFLNAVFAYSYACFIGKTNIYYNFVEHGRHETYMQNALGMYALTIPILVNCKNDKIKNYLSYFSNLVFNSMSNHVYPYRLLREEFNLNNNVLFEYNFDLNDVSNIYDKMIVRDIFIEKDVFSEFFCIINDLDDGYVIHIKHGDMFTNDTAISFVKLFSRILNQMLINEYLEDIMV